MSSGVESIARSVASHQVARECFFRGVHRFLGSRDETSVISPSEWMLTNTGHPKEMGESWSFADHEFQIELLDNTAKHLVVMKSRKLGISEIMMRLALYWIINSPRTTALYTFPTGDDVNRFHDTRLKPILDYSSFLGSFVGDIDNKGSKKIGESHLIMRGTFSERQGQAIESDFMFVDELDFMDKPELIGDFRESMSHSAYGYERDVSVPKFPGDGIDKLYNEGSRARWMVRCVSCNHWQYLTIDQIKEDDRINGYDYGCEKCRKIGSIDRVNGKWEHRDPKAIIKSYHTNQLSAPWKTASSILGLRKIPPYNRHEERFHNQVLGLPHRGHLDALLPDKGVIDGRLKSSAKMVRKYDSLGRASMGVDWGKTSWCQVAIPCGEFDRQIIWLDKIEGGRKEDHALYFTDIAKRFNVGLCIADEGDGEDANPIMLRELGDSFYRCYYWGFRDSLEGRTVGISGREINRKDHRIVVDRTHTIKGHLSTISTGNITVPARDEMGYVETWVEHHLNLNADAKDGESKSEFDVSKIKYGNNGPDHFVHCGVYELLAYDILREVERIREANDDIEDIGVFNLGDDGEEDVVDDEGSVDEDVESYDGGVVIARHKRGDTNIREREGSRRLQEREDSALMKRMKADSKRKGRMKDLIRGR